MDGRLDDSLEESKTNKMCLTLELYQKKNLFRETK